MPRNPRVTSTTKRQKTQRVADINRHLQESPFSVSDGVMELMWAEFVSFAWGQPEFRAAFTKETGIVLGSPAKTPLDAMIDKATGRAEHEAHEFVKWVTRECWGLDYAPEAFRVACGAGGGA